VKPEHPITPLADKEVDEEEEETEKAEKEEVTSILGAKSDQDKRLTRYDDQTRTIKIYGNHITTVTHMDGTLHQHIMISATVVIQICIMTSQQQPMTPRMDVTCTKDSPTRPEGMGSMMSESII